MRLAALRLLNHPVTPANPHQNGDVIHLVHSHPQQSDSVWFLLQDAFSIEIAVLHPQNVIVDEPASQCQLHLQKNISLNVGRL